MLELRNIHKSFGDVRVLDGASLRLEKGAVYTLKGGNGSGKTTMLELRVEDREGKTILRVEHHPLYRRDERQGFADGKGGCILKLEHVTTGYGKKQVLSDVSFSVEKGDTMRGRRFRFKSFIYVIVNSFLQMEKTWFTKK